MNTALYYLRAIQLGLRLGDLEEIEYGLVLDILTEKGNDSCTYRQLPSQADFDRF